MDSDRKKVAASSPNGVIVGSVWESRMKGSFKVFNGDDSNDNSEEIVKATDTGTSELVQLDKKLRSKQSPIGLSHTGKRKTWKSDNNSEGIERKPVQITKVRSENKKILSEQRKELSVSMDGNGIKKIPVQVKKGRQEWNKERSVSIDGIERSPIQRMIKTRSLPQKSTEIGDGIEKTPIALKKTKSASMDGIGIGITDDSDCKKGIEGSIEDIEKVEKSPVENEIKKTRSNSSQSLEEIGVVCEDKLINSDDMGKVKSPHTLDVEEDDENEQDWDEVTAMKMEEIDQEIKEERSIVVVMEMNESSTEQKPSPQINKKEFPPNVVIEDKKSHQKNERTAPISKTIRKQLPPASNHPRIVSEKPTFTKPIPEADELPSNGVPGTHSKLRSFIDLVLWRDVSRSALIFGLGTFSILSSSYTKDLNISFISVISYLGLVYLAAIFIFRSLIFRAPVEVDNSTYDEEYVIGEEDAIWVLKLFLPYINEFLLKVKALFSGDPATTMKLAVLLFVLSRCGSSITIWKMAKLGFFGVFTVPKICSSYSSQLSAYGTFWVRRFRDAWESCSHKKAVAFGIFALIWNLSSTVARIWAVFMLFVVFKYYQQSMLRDKGVVEEEATMGKSERQSSWQGQRHRKIPTSVESTKLKKRS